MHSTDPCLLRRQLYCSLAEFKTLLTSQSLGDRFSKRMGSWQRRFVSLLRRSEEPQEVLALFNRFLKEKLLPTSEGKAFLGKRSDGTTRIYGEKEACVFLDKKKNAISPWEWKFTPHPVVPMAQEWLKAHGKNLLPLHPEIEKAYLQLQGTPEVPLTLVLPSEPLRRRIQASLQPLREILQACRMEDERGKALEEWFTLFSTELRSSTDPQEVLERFKTKLKEEVLSGLDTTIFVGSDGKCYGDRMLRVFLAYYHEQMGERSPFSPDHPSPVSLFSHLPLRSAALWLEKQGEELKHAPEIEELFAALEQEGAIPNLPEIAQERSKAIEPLRRRLRVEMLRLKEQLALYDAQDVPMRELKGWVECFFQVLSQAPDLEKALERMIFFLKKKIPPSALLGSDGQLYGYRALCVHLLEMQELFFTPHLGALALEGWLKKRGGALPVNPEVEIAFADMKQRKVIPLVKFGTHNIEKAIFQGTPTPQELTPSPPPAAPSPLARKKIIRRALRAEMATLQQQLALHPFSDSATRRIHTWVETFQHLLDKTRDVPYALKIMLPTLQKVVGEEAFLTSEGETYSYKELCLLLQENPHASFTVTPHLPLRAAATWLKSRGKEPTPPPLHIEKAFARLKKAGTLPSLPLKPYIPPPSFEQQVCSDLHQLKRELEAHEMRDPLSLEIMLWLEKLTKAVDTYTDLPQTLTAYTQILREDLLIDSIPPLRAPLEVHSWLGSDGHVYGEKALLFYLHSLPEEFAGRAPSNLQDPTLFTVKPHPVASIAVQWVQRHGGMPPTPAAIENTYLDLNSKGELPTLPTEEVATFLETSRVLRRAKAKRERISNENAARAAEEAVRPTAAKANEVYNKIRKEHEAREAKEQARLKAQKKRDDLAKKALEKEAEFWKTRRVNLLESIDTLNQNLASTERRTTEAERETDRLTVEIAQTREAIAQHQAEASQNAWQAVAIMAAIIVIQLSLPGPGTAASAVPGGAKGGFVWIF